MIKNTFEKSHPLFIPFIMAGHPNVTVSTKALISLSEIGADIIELGVPFSDPIADGEINQKAAEKAIKNGITLNRVLLQVKDIRKQKVKTPIILFSYFNPILAFGFEKFCQAASKAGVNGLLIVDLPPEEGAKLFLKAKEYGLEIVLLISPTTNFARLSIYKKLNPSFIYYISRLAVTGIKQDISMSLELELANLKKALPDTKIAVGFGVSSLEQAKHIAKIAEGVIVGSKLVSTLDAKGLKSFTNTAKAFSEAIHNCEKSIK